MVDTVIDSVIDNDSGDSKLHISLILQNLSDYFQFALIISIINVNKLSKRVYHFGQM